MAGKKQLDSYADALFAAQRGFLIIGLAGYTGAGYTGAGSRLFNAAVLGGVSPGGNRQEEK